MRSASGCGGCTTSKMDCSYEPFSIATIRPMKVAVTLPEPLARAAESLARKLRMSRDELCAEAIANYVNAHSATAITARLNAAYERQSSVIDPALQSAQFKYLIDEAW